MRRRALALWQLLGAYMQRKEEARMVSVKLRLKQATRLKKMGGFMGNDGTIQFKKQRDAFGQDVEVSEEQLEKIRVRGHGSQKHANNRRACPRAASD